MKRVALLLFIALAFSSLANAQDIIIANNNPGAPGGVNVYFTLQEAIDSAASGDILHVIPSSVNYGDVNINKPLTVLGVGLVPDKDIGTRSTLSTVTLGANADNVRLSGLQFTSFLTSATSVTISNLIVENCRLFDIDWSGSTNLANMIVRNNIFTSGSYIEAKNGSSGVIFSNNLIYCQNGCLDVTGASFENNLFVGTGTSGLYRFAVQNNNFRRNIFTGMSVNGGSLTTRSGNNWEENLVAGTDTAFSDNNANGNTETGNLFQTDPLMTNITNVSTWNDGFDPTLLATSPAILSSTDRSEDIGPSGGATPFNKEGTDLPLIESVTAPSVIKKGDNLEVRIQASGN